MAAAVRRVRWPVVVVGLLCLGALAGAVARQAGSVAGPRRLADARLGPGGVAQVVAAESRRVAARQYALRGQLNPSDARPTQPQNGTTATATATVAGPGAAGLAGAVRLAAVRGPAVSVELDDAPPSSRGGGYPTGVRTPGPDDLVVHQQDVQAVVNALWSGGAEAMSIMDRRVTARTAVRCVGNTLLLQGQVFSPPFRITAIGDVAEMRTRLRDDPQVTIYRQYVDAYHLGYRVSEAPEATLPASRP
ncbi:exported hypothetical protein [Frankia sp. AiPs1]